MSPLRIGSLCSGYGGLDMAVQAVLGGEIAWHAEVDLDASKVLAHHHPGVPNLGDIKPADWRRVIDEHGPIDAITAGYPCQPFSNAGLRLGVEDERHIWPYIAHAVRVLRPRFVLLENVRGHLGRGFLAVLGDLADLGFDASWRTVRAADVGAPHQRERLFVVATSADADSEQSQRWGGIGVLGGQASTKPCEEDQRERPRHPARHGGALAADAADVGYERGRDARRWRPGSPGRHLPPADPQSDGRDEGRSKSARQLGRPNAALRSAAWGAYASAIRRWETALGRSAPRPTEPGRSGERLSPVFVEWLMGLPAGHVTAVPDISRNAQLRLLGNGVVPQQGAAAFRLLLPALFSTDDQAA